MTAFFRFSPVPFFIIDESKVIWTSRNVNGFWKTKTKEGKEVGGKEEGRKGHQASLAFPNQRRVADGKTNILIERDERKKDTG